jgi:hypothetical protein
MSGRQRPERLERSCQQYTLGEKKQSALSYRRDLHEWSGRSGHTVFSAPLRDARTLARLGVKGMLPQPEAPRNKPIKRPRT